MREKAAFPPFKLYRPQGDHPDWETLKHEALELAAAIGCNLDRSSSFLQRSLLGERKRAGIAKMLQSFRTNKRRMDRGRHNFVPLFYIWTMTNRCNFDCTYCSDHRGSTYPERYRLGFREELTTEQGRRLIKTMRGATAIYFCGGEPTLRRDLPELLDYSTGLNMFNMINTNGSLIGDLLLKPEYRDFLRQMDVIIVSLDALSVERLAGIYRVGRKVAQKTLRNLLALKALQKQFPFKLVANTVITRENIAEVYHVLDWCCDLGITFSPVSANINHHPDRALLHRPDYRNLVDVILERAAAGFPMIASRNALNRLLQASGFSCYPSVFDHIDCDGRMFWPCKAFREAVMVNVLDYENVHDLHRAAAELVAPENFHGSGPGQCGGSCAWMQNCVTDMYARGLSRGLFRSGLIQEIRGLLRS
ncbi:MAG TPA: radical SAM protein [Bacillota bacterium]|nr:radical SAM protein [Bacillota bacterium]